MTSLSITHNGQDVRVEIERRANAVPGLVADALRRTGLDVRDDLRAEMRKAFDRPRPFTLDSLRILSDATASRPYVEVGFRDFAPKGTAAGKYLRAQIEGGPRAQKRSERALTLRSGRKVWLVPTRFAPDDGYGNVPGPFVVKILSALQAFGEQGYRANRTERTRRRDIRRGRDYFAVWPGTNRPGLKPGIYERRLTGFGRGVIPLFVLVSSPPTYQARFPFWTLARASVARRLPARLAAIGQAR